MQAHGNGGREHGIKIVAVGAQRLNALAVLPQVRFEEQFARVIGEVMMGSLMFASTDTMIERTQIRQTPVEEIGTTVIASNLAAVRAL